MFGIIGHRVFLVLFLSIVLTVRRKLIVKKCIIFMLVIDVETSGIREFPALFQNSQRNAENNNSYFVGNKAKGRISKRVL